MYATKLNKSQEALMQSSHNLNQILIASIKKISDIHAHAIRSVAENMQRRMIELCSVKDPMTAPEMLQVEEINDFMDEMQKYQEELTEASQAITKEWVSVAVGTLEEAYNKKSSNVFETVHGGTADGTDFFAAPFKTAIDVAIKNFNETRQSTQNLFNAFEETKNGFSKNMNSSVPSKSTKERTVHMGHVSGNSKKSSKRI